MADIGLLWRFLLYLVDFLLHVGAEIQGKFDFFFFSCSIDIEIGLILSQVWVKKAKQFPFIDGLIEEGTVLIKLEMKIEVFELSQETIQNV